MPEGGDWDAGYKQTFQEKGGNELGIDTRERGGYGGEEKERP